jgi:predicted GIY-YIG superfamily endonuclease
LNTLRDVVKAAFIAIHCGRSTDDVVINPELNAAFISECRKRLGDVSEFDANWKLMNLRKSASLGDVTTDRVRIDHSPYEHASQIAARFMEDQSQLTIDRVFCAPEARSNFDAIALSIAPEVSVYQLRKAALGLRKARRLQPEIVKRIANWERKVISFSAEELASNFELIPRNPGVYIFRDKSGYLYVGEAANLRLRVGKHLDHSDRKALAHYFWDNGIENVTVELHAFAEDSDARKQSARRAYESDLIAKRQPRFNIRP